MLNLLPTATLGHGHGHGVGEQGGAGLHATEVHDDVVAGAVGEEAMQADQPRRFPLAPPQVPLFRVHGGWGGNGRELHVGAGVGGELHVFLFLLLIFPRGYWGGRKKI